MAKVKDKEKVLKAAREKQLVTYINYQQIFHRNFADHKGVA